MASVAAVAPAVAPAPKVEDDAKPPASSHAADALYDRCAERAQGTIFFQRDLSNMQVAESTTQLLTILQDLCDRHLMKLMYFEGETCWKLRTRLEAEKLRRLDTTERLCYDHIDAHQSEGIWMKALRAKMNVQQPTLTKWLKSLESKELVQSVMSVKFPNRKMYLLKHLRPSEDVAGGPWQSEGDFDSPLIEAISGSVAMYVERETCVRVPAGWNDYAPAPDRSAAIEAKKAHVQAARDIEDTAPVPTYRPPLPTEGRLVHRHNPQYPTPHSVAEWLNSKDVLRGRMVRDDDMEQLLEMMVLDSRLEKIGTSYRTALSAADRRTFNGFVDAPCGNCPVFELCGTEGEISARTCVYFEEWLGTETA